MQSAQSSSTSTPADTPLATPRDSPVQAPKDSKPIPRAEDIHMILSDGELLISAPKLGRHLSVKALILDLS